MLGGDWAMEEGYSLPSVLMAGTRYCWMSTGLYIPGRQIIEVSLPEAAASADLKVQIGCHTDDLTRASKLFRGPLVINRCCLDKPTKSITCLWGGLLYIIVPQSSKLGSVPVTVKGAVHAPYYKLGEWGPWREPRGDRAGGEEPCGVGREKLIRSGGGEDGKRP